jgi:hypothetical protein
MGGWVMDACLAPSTTCARTARQEMEMEMVTRTY